MTDANIGLSQKPIFFDLLFISGGFISLAVNIGLLFKSAITENIKKVKSKCCLQPPHEMIVDTKRPRFERSEKPALDEIKEEEEEDESDSDDEPE